MAGVLEHIRRPRRKTVRVNAPLADIDPKVLELEAAKEILAEIFGIDGSEVDEMLKARYEESLERPKASRRNRAHGEPLLKHQCNELQAWPIEFCLAE